MTLLPGGEWSPHLQGWMLIHVSSGAGYWLHPRMNWELQQGAVVLLSDQAQGYVRASQAAGLRLQLFRMEPRKLTGLVSMADQTLMQNAAADEKLSLRVLPPDAQFSDKFTELSSGKARNSFPARVQLLQLFLDVFGGNFQQPPPEATEVVDAKERLKQLLDHTPVSEFLELSFPELVGRTACSPRHVSRLFTELVGVSFREKQAELRLTRACDLLATTDFKVVDVAMESGFQSTSLFSAMFKQRFGTSPARWRERARRRKPAKRAVKRLRVVA
jgi:AraC-like DNA-binding protein